MVDDVSTKREVDLPVLYGVKAGMLTLFDEGVAVPVTVIKLVPNYISKVNTVEKNGYSSYQLAFYEKREKLINKPIKGHLKKANIDHFFSRFAEVRVEQADPALLGCKLTAKLFTKNSFVDVTGRSKGKGFQGVMKRHNFRGGPAAHGSNFHRAPGSIGQRATSSEVFKGRKMPGHMGSLQRTMQNLLLYEVNEAGGYLLVKGSVPGSKNSFVRLSKAVKK